MAFREDDHRLQDGHAAANLSMVRRMALSLLKKMAVKLGMKNKLAESQLRQHLRRTGLRGIIRLIWCVRPALGPDGKSLITAHEDGSIQSRDLSATVADSTEQIRLWSETLSGTTMDTSGIIRPLNEKVWKDQRQRLTELGGPPLK